MRKSRIVLAILAMFVPVLLMGCEGDDGAPGAAGAPGLPGDPGDPGTPGPGALANETCGLCHAAGKIADTAAEHAEARATGTVEANITAASFNPADNTASVDFDFSATDADGNPVVVDLTEAAEGSTNLKYLRFTIARLVPGAGTGDPASWDFYGPRSHRTASQLVDNGGGSYTFTFVDNVALDPAEAGLTHRVGFELNITNFPAEARLRSVNPTLDFVPNGGALTTREIVTTAACNQCHDPLAFHGGRRVDTDYCVLCHNTNNDLVEDSVNFGPIPFLSMIHQIHRADSLDDHRDDNGLPPLEPAVIAGADFSEVTYPQDLRNCTKCHQGGLDSDNWKEGPSREACGACHGIDIFDTGVGHVGGQQTTNAGCAGCHQADADGIAPATSKVHRTENVTPNNPLLPAGLVSFEYGINEVTVDNTNAATIKFFIKNTQDNTFLNLGDNVVTRPAGLNGGPSFLLAYTMEQDGIATPVDYNNLGRTAGQPRSVSIINLPIAAFDTTFSEYTVTVADAFPAGAKMRAVALQGYFSQDTGTDNVARHTPSVQMAVTGDAVRRTVVKSGYTDNDPVNGQPEGCLECHEIFEGHGGNRVNNVQVCVMCHNPNLSSSGRTVDPSQPSSAIDELGGSPLDFPEATNDMKELIHGIHAATDRPYEFVRNRLNGLYFNWSEVTFPGDLLDCQKCHLPGTYNEAPANALWTTERTTTGDPAETRDDVLAARAGVPNLTDLVNSPTASACFYCHDTSAPKSHMVLQGGKFSITREEALQLP